MLAKNWGEPMGAPAIFEKQIDIKLLHSASTEGVTDSGYNQGHISTIVSYVYEKGNMWLTHFSLCGKSSDVCWCRN
ncbi:MAG: hypothetical protein P8X74_23300 [Reinekea sp.]